MSTHKIEIEDGQRQMILLALAELSMSRPGFDYALNEIAIKMDNVEAGRGKLYDDFRAISSERSQSQRG